MGDYYYSTTYGKEPGYYRLGAANMPTYYRLGESNMPVYYHLGGLMDKPFLPALALAAGVLGYLYWKKR